MTLDQIIQIDRTILALCSRLAPILDPETRKALDQAGNWVSEVRHFAGCVQDAREALPSLQHKQMQEARDRLIQVFTPD